MKLKSILFASAAAMLSVSAAHANDYKGLYGKIGAGVNFVAADRDFDANDTTGIDGAFDYDTGLAVFSAIGYDYGLLRGEFEFAYRNNDIRQIAGESTNFAGFNEGDITGDVNSYSIMANVLYDFDYAADSIGFDVTPYIGGGLGVTFANFDINGATDPAVLQGPELGFANLDIDQTASLFSYQGIAGLSFGIAENLNLDVEYRYFGTFKRGIETSLGEVDTTLDSHNILAALRFNFGAPAAAAAAAPVAIQYKDCWDGSSVPVSSSCPPEIQEEVDETADPIQVTVYFDYDKSNLTSEASSLIREAVSRARQFDVDRVNVIGNTDTSGSSAYNQALSERRARVVRDALIAQGIPAGIITSSAAGESNPAKATADGVREPLNRRTEITILFE